MGVSERENSEQPLLLKITAVFLRTKYWICFFAAMVFFFPFGPPPSPILPLLSCKQRVGVESVVENFVETQGSFFGSQHSKDLGRANIC